MYKNFEEYWKQKKNILEKLGVDKDAAHMIWCDAVDVVSVQVKQYLLSKGVEL